MFRAQKPQAAPQTGNYLNVPNFLNPAGRDDDPSSSSDEDETDAHDYQNNPIERQKYEEEQKRKKAINQQAKAVLNASHAKTLQAGTPVPIPPVKKSNSFHPNSQSTKITSNYDGHGDLAAPAANAAGHSPGRKGYLNMSKSLENLDKRTVPQPPPLPSNPVIKVPSIERHCSPPKPHLGKSSGYINQTG